MPDKPELSSRTPVIIAPPELPPPEDALALLERLARAPWLVAPPVGLPDLHLKPRLEAPSSLATATDAVWVLGLTSPSPHCGMGLALTERDIGFATPERLDRLFTHLATRLNPDRGAMTIDDAALDEALLGGWPAWQPRETRVQTMGTLDPYEAAFSTEESHENRERMLDAVPDWLRGIARQDFGLVGKGNHFLELQAVEEILDPEVAKSWGLWEGQLVVMIHADSGHLGAFLGRFFAYRRKNTRRGRLIEWRTKVPYHARRVATLTAWLERARVFWPGRWVPLSVGSETGQLCRRALGVAANYADAGRLAIWGTIADALAAVDGAGALRVLWDAPHNGIWRESVEGRQAWVHRHNAARALPGRPVLLPGCERTSSFLCVGREGAVKTLYSANHGAGESAQRLGHRLEDEDSTTRIYGYAGAIPESIPRISDDGIWAVVNTLRTHEIARPVARLRPLATLKARTR